ncbi:MipA/OmpV family protein [Chitinolyticbacter meiyuanensis]|uniref:MipA/OmpV family protein n=1 Tax=Chitinolyticbacter meiyuanensis TaxID=682798 RepID=UPI0011E5ED08|nr:MipA/OmpV family protein [Chitinolyticbacter meiyuanensis]
MLRALPRLSLLLSAPLLAQPLDLPGSLPNLAGIGVGMTSDYSGSNDTMVGVVPGLRYVTADGHLLELYGPYAQYNLGQLQGWQWGPALSLRLGRENVDDEVVARIHEIDTTLEAGGFVGYEYLNRDGYPWRARAGVAVLTNAGVVYGGARATATGTLWLPVSPRVMVGGGLGASWVSADFNRTYYGVTDADAAASGLPGYTPGGGLQQWYGWLGMIVQLTPSWYGGAMAFLQRLSGDAGASPIVTERGDRDQWTYGVGLGYAWR